ncbi:MAG: 4-hydroxythreonine-4-phosphate dehydrogenase PdxA [Pseudomonadota bacterium]
MTNPASLPLALTLGDPAGCGPQISLKAWDRLKDNGTLSFGLVAPFDLVRSITEDHHIQRVQGWGEVGDVFPRALPVFDISDTEASLPPVTPGRPNTAHAPATLASIRRGVELVQSGHAAALVTNPINKAELYAAGFEHPGHTEFLADLCRSAEPGVSPPVMMLVGGGLKVALATIHVPLREVPNTLNTDHLASIGRTTATALKRDFGLETPRLVFSGLNPHAGECGTIGDEEIKIINPAAARLRGEGLDIQDARPGDTVFAEALAGDYDAVIAMTHDQGLIPVKTLDFWGGVNVTLGLPIIRTSPDHGTAYDAAASRNCRPDSLIAAIELAARNARRRRDG